MKKLLPIWVFAFVALTLSSCTDDCETKGGFSINPTIGYKLPMRNGSAWLINVGYRIQRAKYSQKRTDDFYWYESNEVRNYKRFVVRFGIEF